MKHFVVFLLWLVLCCGVIPASGRKHKERGLPRTEVGLMNNVLGCLEYKDSVSYYNLFLPFDTLWSMVLHNPNHTPEAQKQLDNLKEHPQSLIDFDPYYNRKILGGFYKVLQKGEDSGIHWKEIVMQRYELNKETTTNKNLIGYDIIAPERFKGYIFVRDLLGRLTFCIAITEIQKIDGYFYGGQVTNILEASNVEEYLVKEKKEQQYFDWLAKHPDYDSVRNDSMRKDSLVRGLIDTSKQGMLLSAGSPDDDKPQTRKEVVDRKYYEGKFDNEIPVKLYVRYMKDPKTGKVVAYDGLYKFGDQRDYAKLIITRSDDGVWTMEDDPPVGTLELKLQNKAYTGSWTNNENQTGYDVLLKQTDIPEQKLEQLDNILEKNLSGTVNEGTLPDKSENKKKDENADTGLENY